MKQLSFIEKTFFLKKTDLFKDLDLDLLIAIANKVTQDLYDKGEKIFEMYQIANRLYLIAKGEVELFDQQNRCLSVLKEEDFFGDESLFNDMPRAYSAICKKDSVLLTISKSNLMMIISECPEVATALLRNYSKNTLCRFMA